MRVLIRREIEKNKYKFENKQRATGRDGGVMNRRRRTYRWFVCCSDGCLERVWGTEKTRAQTADTAIIVLKNITMTEHASRSTGLGRLCVKRDEKTVIINHCV